MVGTVNANAPRVNAHQEGQEHIERGIKHRRNHHHNHHGAHQHASEKERLKKLVNELERALGYKINDNEHDEDAQNDVRKMVHHHVTSSVNTLKDKYGLNDDKLKHVHNLVEADNAMASQGDIVLSGGIAVLYLFMNLLSDIAQFKYTEMQQKAKVSRDAQSMANKVQEIIADISKGSDPDTATKPLPDDVIKYMEQNDIKVGDQTIDQYLGGKRQAPAKTWTMTQYSNDWHKTTGTIQVYKKDGKFYQWDAKNHKGTEIKGVSDKYGEGKLFYQPDGKKNGYWMSWGDSKNANSTTNTPMKDDGFNNNALDKGKLDAVKSALENESNRASDYVSQSQLQLQKVMQTYNVTVSLINSMQTMLEEMNKSIAQNIR